jgi:hypothetical protein
MVGQIHLGLGELAVHRLQQIAPAAQRRIEFYTRGIITPRRRKDYVVNPRANN